MHTSITCHSNGYSSEMNPWQQADNKLQRENLSAKQHNKVVYLNMDTTMHFLAKLLCKEMSTSNVREQRIKEKRFPSWMYTLITCSVEEIVAPN